MPPKPPKKYTKEELQRAVQLVKEGHAMREVIKKMPNIPYTTLQGRVSGKRIERVGKPPVIPVDIEKELAITLQQLSALNVPLSQSYVTTLAKNLLDAKGNCYFLQ